MLKLYTLTNLDNFNFRYSKHYCEFIEKLTEEEEYFNDHIETLVESDINGTNIPLSSRIWGFFNRQYGLDAPEEDMDDSEEDDEDDWDEIKEVVDEIIDDQEIRAIEEENKAETEEPEESSEETEEVEEEKVDEPEEESDTDNVEEYDSIDEFDAIEKQLDEEEKLIEDYGGGFKTDVKPLKKGNEFVIDKLN